MTTPCNQPTVNGPLDWLFASMGEWGRLLAVARELRGIDSEWLDTMLEARTRGPDPLSPEGAVKVRSLLQMLTSLDLDPDAIRLTQPETMQVLEAACVGCTQRSRCDHELTGGTAAVTYPEFCPNAPRLKALLSVQAAAQ
jgi:hypothetical protein